jgi:hypothetical protein
MPDRRLGRKRPPAVPGLRRAVNTRLPAHKPPATEGAAKGAGQTSAADPSNACVMHTPKKVQAVIASLFAALARHGVSAGRVGPGRAICAAVFAQRVARARPVVC